MQQPPQWCRIPHILEPPSIDVLQADTGLSRTGGTWLLIRRGADLIRCIGICAGASCPIGLADPGERPPWWLRSALSSSALCYPPFSRQRRGPTGEVGGSGGRLAAAISRHQETCVYWILEQVYHTPRTLSSILYSVLRGGFHWAAGGGARGAVGPFVRALLSRAAGAGRRRTADAGLSRLRPRHPARVVRAALARRKPPTSFVIRLQPWRLTTPPAGAAERVLCMGRATPHRLPHRRFSGPGTVATPGLYVGPGQVAAAPARAACKKTSPQAGGAAWGLGASLH